MASVGRRTFLATMAAVAGLGARPSSWRAEAQTPGCATPKEVKGFLTCADVARAEKEGAIVTYFPGYERWFVGLFKDFNQLFPSIDTSKYLQSQTGRLYAKITAERRASTFAVDVLCLSDVVVARDFVKAGGFAQYVSPSLKEYAPNYRSDPPGYYTWMSTSAMGFVYNANLVKEAESPKSYKDLLDPKWRGAINFRDSASGFQSMQWLMARKLYGDQYWKEMAVQRPRGLASGSQQTERVASGEDKINAICQYGVYTEFKQKGAPLGFSFPSDGVFVGPEVVGVVDKAPHPEAAKLFVDWFLSPLGQQSYQRVTGNHSPRRDVPPPAGARPLSELKVWVPDWDELTTLHPQYVKEWNALVGMPAAR